MEMIQTLSPQILMRTRKYFFTAIVPQLIQDLSVTMKKMRNHPRRPPYMNHNQNESLKFLLKRHRHEQFRLVQRMTAVLLPQTPSRVTCLSSFWADLQVQAMLWTILRERWLNLPPQQWKRYANLCICLASRKSSEIRFLDLRLTRKLWFLDLK